MVEAGINKRFWADGSPEQQAEATEGRSGLWGHEIVGVNASRRFFTEDTASRWFSTGNSPVVGPRTKFTTVQRFQAM